MIKKTMALFLVLLSLLALVRYILFFDMLSFGTFVKEYVFLLLLSLAVTIGIFFVARISRFIYNEPFSNTHRTTMWMIIVIVALLGISLYVYSLIEKDVMIKA